MWCSWMLAGRRASTIGTRNIHGWGASTLTLTWMFTCVSNCQVQKFRTRRRIIKTADGKALITVCKHMTVIQKVLVLSVDCDDLLYAKTTFWRKLKQVLLLKFIGERFCILTCIWCPVPMFKHVSQEGEDGHGKNTLTSVRPMISRPWLFCEAAAAAAAAATTTPTTTPTTTTTCENNSNNNNNNNNNKSQHGVLRIGHARS